jgi:hypothetical protein
VRIFFIIKIALYDFGCKMRISELSSFCDETISQAHLKKGAFSTNEKRCVKAPSFKTIFDWRREKGFGDELELKTELCCIF